MSMGARLAQAWRGQNLTQEQLAEQLGVTRQAVSRWESDAAYPETDKIVRMAALLGVSCDYLLNSGAEEAGSGGSVPPSPVTRLLRQAVGRKVRLESYEDDGVVVCDWCTILDFDSGWANVEFARKKKDWRETRLIPIFSIRAITFLPEEEKGGHEG